MREDAAAQQTTASDAGARIVRAGGYICSLQFAEIHEILPDGTLRNVRAHPVYATRCAWYVGGHFREGDNPAYLGYDAL